MWRIFRHSLRKMVCARRAMVKRDAEIIGYDQIKKRRLNEIPVPCCEWRKVGESVPFYFCPRSPMLSTINKGNTGRPEGCQKSIVHLVPTMAAGIGTGKAWAISSGNAGANHTTLQQIWTRSMPSTGQPLAPPSGRVCSMRNPPNFWWQTFSRGRPSRKSAVKIPRRLIKCALPWRTLRTVPLLQSKPTGIIKP